MSVTQHTETHTELPKLKENVVQQNVTAVLVTWKSCMWALKVWFSQNCLIQNILCLCCFYPLMPKQMDLHHIRSWGIKLQKIKISCNWENDFNCLIICTFFATITQTPLCHTFILQCVQIHICVPHIHPFLLSPVVAELVIQPSSSRGPLCCQPAYASLHEAQRFLPGAHLLQQSPNVRLEDSLDDRSNKKV